LRPSDRIGLQCSSCLLAPGAAHKSLIIYRVYPC
jgi:hypothetical protein